MGDLDCDGDYKVRTVDQISRMQIGCRSEGGDSLDADQSDYCWPALAFCCSQLHL